jgi:hypothetical protein
MVGTGQYECGRGRFRFSFADRKVAIILQETLTVIIEGYEM